MCRLNNLSVLVLLFFCLLSCGRSPFVDDTAPKSGDVQERGILGQQSIVRTDSYELHFHWLSPIKINEQCKLLVMVKNGASLVELDGQLRAKIWMPTMGHGSFPISVNKVSTGLYELNEIFFTMPGLWDFHLEVFKNNQLSESGKWSLNL